MDNPGNTPLSGTTGIKCSQQLEIKIAAAIGSVIFLFGLGKSYGAWRTILATRDYFELVFLAPLPVGAIVLLYAWYKNRQFRRWGPSPLILDPPNPGVGGQVGGKFCITSNTAIATTIDSDQSTTATLTCYRRNKSNSHSRKGSSSSISIKWQESVPVYLQSISGGFEGFVIFDIPSYCLATTTKVYWKLDIKGNLENGKIHRTWKVQMGRTPGTANSTIAFPYDFFHNELAKKKAQANNSALKQIPITEDERYINILSAPGRKIKPYALGIIFAGLFTTMGFMGLFGGMVPGGIVFTLVGSTLLAWSVFFLCRKIEVKIDKKIQVLFTRQSLLGYVFAYEDGLITCRSQFTIEKLSSETRGDKLTEFYKLVFRSNGNDIIIATNISGRNAADALRKSIVAQYFDNQPESLAA